MYVIVSELRLYLRLFLLASDQNGQIRQPLFRCRRIQKLQNLLPLHKFIHKTLLPEANSA